jgi:hypothetical protein
MCKEETRKYVCKLRDNYYFNCLSRTKDPKNPKVIVKRSREPLIEKLCKNGNVPHPFIVQCIKQGCDYKFKNEDGLKNHLINYHKCIKLMVRMYEIYALSQIYQEEFSWWSDNNEKMVFLKVNNDWETKGTCLFKNCNFGERHNSLNIERCISRNILKTHYILRTLRMNRSRSS